jgi:hypothetical protein
MKNKILRALNWRVWMMLLAGTAFVASFVIWINDGAWDYGAMPTKGLIRTAAFVCSSIVCFGISIVFQSKDR